MPEQYALRLFKAALFESFANPIRTKLLRRLSPSMTEVGILIECLAPVERSAAAYHLAVLEENRIIERHEAGTNLYYSMDSASLQRALVLIDENPGWPIVLANPVTIEILEILCERPYEHSELIRKIESEGTLDRLEIKVLLAMLVGISLIELRREHELHILEIKLDCVRQVLHCLRDYFEEHLLTALDMINRMSFAHISQESERLKNRLRSQSEMAIPDSGRTQVFHAVDRFASNSDHRAQCPRPPSIDSTDK